MTYFLHDIIEGLEPAQNTSNCSKLRVFDGGSGPIHTIREKLEMPPVDRMMIRPRLDRLFENSLSKYPATLVCGRSGSGKTAAAAGFCQGYKGKVAWFTVESSDASWTSFSHYFTQALDTVCPGAAGKARGMSGDPATSVPAYLSSIAEMLCEQPSNEPAVIVLENFHHLFDAEWFVDLFIPLMTSLAGGIHLILITRSKPPGPLWRMRSKQVLNVVDEKLLSFTRAETTELYELSGLPRHLAWQAHENSFGRASWIRDALVSDLMNATNP